MRRQRLALLAATALGVALATGGFMALATSGGPPPETPSAGVKVYRPVAESWRLVSVGAEEGGVLCTDETPCDAGALDAAAANGSACAWQGRVWLSAANMPGVVRGVHGVAYAVVASGDGEALDEGRRNLSTHEATFPAPWANGWWWRAESERVDVVVPVPCDARELTVSLNYEGVDPLGGAWADSQSVDVALAAPQG